MVKRHAIVAVIASVTLCGAASASAAWTPPLGIPAPSFGINETAPAVPNPWTAATAGFYYVDATQLAATDSSNPYGTPARPRRTIPTVLPAGAVVELHGTYDADHTSPNGILSQGTSARPVFIRGASSTTRPLIRNGWEVQGTYFVLENLEFGPLNSTQTGTLVILAPTNHASLRYSELHGNLSSGGLGVVSWNASLTENVVVYQTYIHDNGDVNANYDQDVHGIAVSSNVDYLWVVDSQLARNSGDGIQINAGSVALQPTTHHIYVGRNTAFNNKQTGFWVKQAVDVVFSQNECHSHRPGNSSFGQCMGYQYGTDWVWFLFNHIYDSEYGIAAAADSGLGTGTQAYYVGNLIHNIHHTDPSYNPGTSWSSAGILLAGGVNRYVINNTIYDVDAGVNVAAPNGMLEIGDNVIANVTVAAANHVFVEQPSLAAATSLHHNDLQGDARVNLASTVVHLTAAQLATVSSTNADPKFVSPTTGDFHLQAGSPAIDKGETNSVYAVFQQRYGFSLLADRDGSLRPVGAAMDMGAYEYGGVPGSGGGSGGGYVGGSSGSPTGIAPARFESGGSGDAWLYNVASGAFSEQVNGSAGFAQLRSGTWSTGWSIYPGDFDGNGMTDLLFYNASYGYVTLALNQGGGQFAWYSIQWTPGWTLTILDLNGDGRSDVFLYNPYSGVFVECFSNGAGAFQYIAGQWSGGWQVFAADWNGDGRGDLFLYNPGTGGWFQVTTQANGSFAYSNGTWATGWQPYPSDYSGDGRTDVFLYNPASGAWVMATSGNGGFTYQPGQWSSGWTVTPADLNGDGRADIFVYNKYSGAWVEAFSSGSGFTYANAQWSSGWTVTTSDFNGDGRTDILVYEPISGRWVQALAGSTPGTFTYRSGTWMPNTSLVIANRPAR